MNNTQTREIKFRAWDSNENRMSAPFGICDREINYYDDKDVFMAETYDLDCVEFTITQYTGLKDKNGKEIYEGDIVNYKQVTGFACEDDGYKVHGIPEKPKVVEFRDGQFYPREYYSYCEDGFYAWRIFDFEIIGNIYKNPELLSNPPSQE